MISFIIGKLFPSDAEKQTVYNYPLKEVDPGIEIEILKDRYLCVAVCLRKKLLIRTAKSC